LQISNNVEEGAIQIQLARKALPNNAQVEAIAGRAARRQDRWEQAIVCLERAVSLEPRDASLRALLADTYRFMRRYPEYDRTIESAIALTPSDKLAELPIVRTLARLECCADLAPLREAIVRQTAAHQLGDAEPATYWMMLAVWSHDAEGIARILSNKHDPIGWNGVVYPDAWFEALAARIRGDNDAAMKAFTIARRSTEQRVLADPSVGLDLSVLAIIDAALGHRELAVQEGRQACDLYSSKASNFLLPAVRSNLAVVYAWTGQNDLAIAELNALINRPAPTNAIAQPTYGDFRLNPLWDPLRNDPRFETLVQRLAPVASR
jgi:tetratricopeptide (TPR) repeat protein